MLDGFCVHVLLWIAEQDAEAPAEVSGTIVLRAADHDDAARAPEASLPVMLSV